MLDEPVSALDVSVQAQVLNLLAELREQLGVAYLLVSHDLGVVHRDRGRQRVAALSPGTVIEQQPEAHVVAEECGVVERGRRVRIRAPLQQHFSELRMVRQPSCCVQGRAVAELGDSSNGGVRVGACVEQRLGHLDQYRLSGW